MYSIEKQQKNKEVPSGTSLFLFEHEVFDSNRRGAGFNHHALTISHDILPNKNYITKLKNKLLEETQKFIDAKNHQKLKEEIVDIIEVIEHLIDIYSFDKNELQNIKENKEIKYGKFDKKIKTHYVEMQDNYEEIAYYLSKPHKYPEIK